MAVKQGQKNKGRKVDEPSKSVNDIEKDSNVVLTKTPEEVNGKRDKAKEGDKGKTGFIAFCRKFDPIAMCCFIAVLLAGVVVIGAHVNAMYINPEWNSPVAVNGDTVKVEYVGSYGGYYDQEGAVIFDTNMKSVNDSSDYVKSLSYKDKTKFEYLEFKVGGTDVLKGFGDAVIGKLINWTAKVKIAPADGYGVAEKMAFSNVHVISKTGTMTLADFNKHASSEIKASELNVGPVYVDMPNGLKAEVVNAPDGKVSYRYISDFDALKTDETLTQMKVDANVKFKVTEHDSATFTVEYTVDESSPRMYNAIIMEDGVEQTVIVDDFDKKGEFLYKLLDGSQQQEQKGEYLYFYIKIVDINGYAKA